MIRIVVAKNSYIPKWEFCLLFRTEPRAYPGPDARGYFWFGREQLLYARDHLSGGSIPCLDYLFDILKLRRIEWAQVGLDNDVGMLCQVKVAVARQYGK